MLEIEGKVREIPIEYMVSRKMNMLQQKNEASLN